MRIVVAAFLGLTALVNAENSPSPVPSASPLPLHVSSNSDGWEKFDEFNGISMFRKEVPGDSLLAYKGAGELKGSTAKLIAIIEDTPRKPEWMSRIKRAEVVERLSPDERIEYIHVNLPWPLNDRDFVYRVTSEIDTAHQQLKLTFKSIDDPRRPVSSDKVRAWVHYTNFYLKPINGGTSTWVEADAYVDPKGLIPKWAVNLYQKRLPRESLEGLAKQMLKRGIASSPKLKRLLEVQTPDASKPSPTPSALLPIPVLVK